MRKLLTKGLIEKLRGNYMKLGISLVMNFKNEMQITDFLQYAYDKKLAAVELVAEPPFCQIEQIDSKQRERLRLLASELNLELTVHAPFSDLNIAAYNSRVRDFAQQMVLDSIILASEIGASTVTIHPGELNAGGASYPDEVLENNFNAIKYLTAQAKEVNVKISYENNPIFSWNQIEESYDPYKIQDLVNQIKEENLGITWDIGHSNTTQFKMIEFFSCFKDKLLNVHLHDNNGPGQGWTDTHQALGQGTINWSEIINFLKVINYQGTCILEVNSHEKIDASINYLSGVLN